MQRARSYAHYRAKSRPRKKPHVSGSDKPWQRHGDGRSKRCRTDCGFSSRDTNSAAAGAWQLARTLMPLPAPLRSLLEAPRYAVNLSVHRSGLLPAGVTGIPRPPPRLPLLQALFDQIVADAASRNVAWGEWLTISTATLFALNAPGTLKAMFRYAVRDDGTLRSLPERVDRACLMREAGLKCLGLIGTPKVGTISSHRLSTTLLRYAQRWMPMRSSLRPCQQRRGGTW